MITAARAVYRGYVTEGKRAGRVRRLHVIRDDGPKGWEPGKQTMCGQHAWDVTRSDTRVIDPMPHRPPEGLTWCPSCIGRLAERYGLLNEIAGEVVSYDPGLVDLAGQRWWAYVDEQREARRGRMTGGAP